MQDNDLARHIRSVNEMYSPCPCCGHHLNIYQAAKMEKAKDKFDNEAIVRNLECNSCRQPLKQSVIFDTKNGYSWEKA